MTHRRTGLIRIAIGIVAVAIAGCAAQSRERTLSTSKLEKGAGTLTDTRKTLEGTWTLKSLELVDGAGARKAVKAGGQLTYDGFGNMSVRGVIEDPALKNSLVIDYSGRITIDTVRHEFYPADLVSDRPLESGQAVQIAPDKLRRYQLSADTFIVTYLDAAAKPTAVISWGR